MFKKIRYLIEGLAVTIAFRILAVIPYNMASALCGRLLRSIGPALPRTQTVRSNLQHALPELDAVQTAEIISSMWENLGRVLGEFPHMGKMNAEEFAEIVTVEGIEHIHAARQGSTGTLFFSGHIANWELAPKTLAIHDCPLALVYRKGNNPLIDRLIQQTRAHYQLEGVAKGASGSRQLIRALRSQQHIGMLLDQKMNTGIPVKFFGREAMTATAIASLALRFDCPIVPVKIVRQSGVHHKVTLMPPLEYVKTGIETDDTRTIMTAINAILEQWIREHPAQWIWLHNRWPRTSGNSYE
jgi:KDO2-lipid IV(A) lauroyltransferase